MPSNLPLVTAIKPHQPDQIACTTSKGAVRCSAHIARTARKAVCFEPILRMCAPRSLPFAGFDLLMQGEYLHVVVDRKPTDQSQERRNHPIFQGSVDASGNHQCYAHRIFSGPRPSVAACPAALARLRPPRLDATPDAVRTHRGGDTRLLNIGHSGWFAA